jgi:hypothetical protein
MCVAVRTLRREMRVAGRKLRGEMCVAGRKLRRAELIRKIKKTQHGYFRKKNSSLTKENTHPCEVPSKLKLSVLCKTYSSFLVAKIPINIYYFFNQKTSYSFILYVEEKSDPRFRGFKQGSDF